MNIKCFLTPSVYDAYKKVILTGRYFQNQYFGMKSSRDHFLVAVGKQATLGSEAYIKITNYFKKLLTTTLQNPLLRWNIMFNVNLKWNPKLLGWMQLLNPINKNH